MEWWDRRAVCGFADRQSQSDWLGSRAVHGDHRKRPITAPHSRLPLSSARIPGLLFTPFLTAFLRRMRIEQCHFLSSYIIITRFKYLQSCREYRGIVSFCLKSYKIPTDFFFSKETLRKTKEKGLRGRSFLFFNYILCPRKLFERVLEKQIQFWIS